MDDVKRRELGERLLPVAGAEAFEGWDSHWLARGTVWPESAVRLLLADGAEPVPDPQDGRNLRAALEWAREVTGDCWLAVRPAEDPDGALWWEAMTVGPSEDEVGRATWSATEAEAHVALAEWAAEFRKAHKGLDD